MSDETKRRLRAMRSPDPTPEQIRQRTARIRATWSPGVEAARLVGPATPPPWVPPCVPISPTNLPSDGRALDGNETQ